MAKSDKIKQLLNAAISTNNTTIIYKCLSESIQEAKKLGMTKVVDILVNAQSSSTIQEIKTHIAEALKQIETEEENKNSENMNAKAKYLDVKKIVYAEQYKKDKEKRANIKKQINRTEKEIVNWPEYNDRLHEEIKYGKWAGYLHALVNNNTRIMYTVENIKNKKGEPERTLIFRRIITKNEFDSGN